MTTKTDELKPCPFCGERKNLIVQHCEGTITHPAFRMYCDNCGASTGYSDRVDPVENWNRRAALQSQDRTAWINTLERKAEALWTAAGEDRHEAMKDLLNHARIGVQSQNREDAERLDWLESCEEAHGFCHTGYGEYRYYAHQTKGLPSVREAIDHARRIEGEAK